MTEPKRFYPYLRGDGVPVADPLFHSGESGSNPTSPLQLHFHEIPVETACLLNAYWHSRLPRIIASNVFRNRWHICYQAEYENGVYASAIWSSPCAENRFEDGKSIIELRRLAIGPEAPKNTATRMIGWMMRDVAKRFHLVRRAISYQDTEVHTGTIYKAAGWSPVATNDGADWISGTRLRKGSQSTAHKVRWEKVIR